MSNAKLYEGEHVWVEIPVDGGLFEKPVSVKWGALSFYLTKHEAVELAAELLDAANAVKP